LLLNRYLKEIAEIFEADNNKESALDYYQQAAGMFENDNKKTTATQCHLKVAPDSSLSVPLLLL
jgi:alpha-soluble NSF attachment protein